jgi:hypothetical protein
MKVIELSVWLDTLTLGMMNSFAVKLFVSTTEFVSSQTVSMIPFQRPLFYSGCSTQVRVKA